MKNDIIREEIGGFTPNDFVGSEFGVTPNDVIDKLEDAEGGSGDNTDGVDVDGDKGGVSGEGVIENGTTEDVDGEDADGEVGDDGIDYDSADVKIKTNVVKLLASRLKEDGMLPEDFEVTDDTTSEDVEIKYREYLESTAKEEIKEELKREYGITDYDINKSIAQKYGISDDEIKLKEVYSKISSVDIDEVEDSENFANILFTQYYIDKGLSEKEATKMAYRDVNDEDLDIIDLIDERQSYFKKRSDEIGKNIETAINNKRKEEEDKVKDRVKSIKKHLKSGVIDNVRYSKKELDEFEKALFEKSEIMEVDGKRIRVTPFQKKKIERSRDIEKSLKDAIDFYFGYNKGTVEKRARKKERRKIVDNLNDLIKVEVDLKRHQREDGDIVRREIN